MPIQAATTGNLENAQNIMIAEMRFTAEHLAPCANLINKLSLAKGQKQITWPKVGQMEAQSLSDGVDLVASEDIGLSSVDLTPAEVGLKVILSDKLVRQFYEDIFRIIGRQMGDAMARKKDTDVIALFSSLGASLSDTLLGVDNIALNLTRAAACVAYATAQKFPRPVSFVHHPNAIAALSMNAAGVGTTYFPGVQPGLPEELLRNFWKINVDGVNFYHDGNIEKITGYDSGYGAIFSKDAMAIIQSLAPTTERERDASLRATEIVIVSDYGVFEVDDAYGVAAQYEIGNLDTT